MSSPFPLNRICCDCGVAHPEVAARSPWRITSIGCLLDIEVVLIYQTLWILYSQHSLKEAHQQRRLQRAKIREGRRIPSVPERKNNATTRNGNFWKDKRRRKRSHSGIVMRFRMRDKMKSDTGTWKRERGLRFLSIWNMFADADAFSRKCMKLKINLQGAKQFIKFPFQLNKTRTKQHKRVRETRLLQTRNYYFLGK